MLGFPDPNPSRKCLLITSYIFPVIFMERYHQLSLFAQSGSGSPMVTVRELTYRIMVSKGIG